MSFQLVPVEFNERAFEELEGTTFSWKTPDGKQHPRSWYKKGFTYGVTPSHFDSVLEGRNLRVSVYRMKKDGCIDFRKLSAAINTRHLRPSKLEFKDQGLL